MTDTLTPDRRWDRATFHAELGQWIEAAEVLADQPDAANARPAPTSTPPSSAAPRPRRGHWPRPTRPGSRQHADRGYAQLLLGRALARQSRHDEATGPLKLATALGVS